MKNSTYSVLSHAVSTVKKSQAQMPSAWDLRNSLHVGPSRRGAGPTPGLSENRSDGRGADVDAELASSSAAAGLPTRMSSALTTEGNSVSKKWAKVSGPDMGSFAASSPAEWTTVR
jgi:hypothetical protein